MDNRITPLLPKIRPTLLVLASVLLLRAITSPEQLAGLQNYAPLHTLLEVVSITISGAIFALGLSVYPMRPSQNVWWIAWMFLAVALLDCAHLLSYENMPEFVTPAGAEKAINFWLVARSFAAVALFVLAAGLLPATPPRRRFLLPLVVLALVAACFLAFLFWPEWMPRTFIPGTGLTPFKILFEYGLIAVYSVTGVLLIWRELQVTDRRASAPSWYLANAVLIMALSEYMFTLYGSLTDMYNVYGHVLKVFAYGLLLRGLFVNIVQQPYLDLSNLENERSAVFDALPDAILALDHDRRVQALLHTTPAFESLGLPLASGQPLASYLGPGWDAALKQACDDAHSTRASTIAPLFVAQTPSGASGVFALTVARLLHVHADSAGWLVLFRDVTAQEQLRSRAERLSAILSVAPLAIAVVDRSLHMGFVNRSFKQRFGADTGGILPLDDAARAEIDASLRHGRSHQFEWRWTDAAGQQRVDNVFCLPLTDAEGTQTGAMVFFEDVSERALMEEQLRNILQFDQLTGLPKRRLLAKRFEEALGAPAASGKTATLLRLNIDGFSRINATYGRGEGDLLLQRLSENLRSALPAQVVLSRDEGHDFAAFAVGMAQDDVAELVNSVLHAVRQPLQVGRETIRLSACIGLARYPEDGTSFEGLSDATDAALRVAKEQGPGSWHAFSAGLRERLARFMAISIHLREAIENNEFSLCYQPQMSADGAFCLGAEALVRWRSDSLGQVSPEEFITVAEATGDIKAIGTQVFTEVVAAISRWSAMGLAVPTISVNLSAAEFEDPETVGHFIDIATRARIPRQMIALELTERTLVQDDEAAITTIAAFQKEGFGIALDDFGAGQTSLRYLLHLPVQMLKIDKALTAGIVDDPRSAAVVRSVVDLAHQLGMGVVAEGVETAAQQAKAVELGCDEIQGHYFCRPLAEADFLKFVAGYPSARSRQDQSAGA